MNAIRFVHTDSWRLADSISGLAAAPEWLRRLACDATRSSVLRTLETAVNHEADFLLVAGSCTTDAGFHQSVADWLREPLTKLQQAGIPIAMAAGQAESIIGMADVVIPHGHHLVANREFGRVTLGTAVTNIASSADLVVSPLQVGDNRNARCEYLYSPHVQHSVTTTPGGQTVYSAGAGQSHGPEETGKFGCLLVEARLDTQCVSAELHATDTLRFENRTVATDSARTPGQICQAIVDESRELARHTSQTIVVDWHVTHPVDISDEDTSQHQHDMLESVRGILQNGHLGVWPRRIAICSPAIPHAEHSADACHALRSLLFEDGLRTRDGNEAAWQQFLTGTRLLQRAA